jgi:hypothetical protein
MKTRDEAVSFLYASADRFAAKALPVFQANGWEWAHGVFGCGVPGIQEIRTTVASLIWDCTKSGGQNCAGTGRIEVFVRQTDRGDWISGIQLVAESERSY